MYSVREPVSFFTGFQLPALGSSFLLKKIPGLASSFKKVQLPASRSLGADFRGFYWLRLSLNKVYWLRLPNTDHVGICVNKNIFNVGKWVGVKKELN
jgi:hypothetical protein